MKVKKLLKKMDGLSEIMVVSEYGTKKFDGMAINLPDDLANRKIIGMSVDSVLGMGYLTIRVKS